MGEPNLDTTSIRVLHAIQRVRQLPNFQGYLDYDQLNTQQQARADELCNMQGEDPAFCLYGIAGGQVTQIVHPAYTHFVGLTEASENEPE